MLTQAITEVILPIDCVDDMGYELDNNALMIDESELSRTEESELPVFRMKRLATMKGRRTAFSRQLVSCRTH